MKVCLLGIDELESYLESKRGRQRALEQLLEFCNNNNSLPTEFNKDFTLDSLKNLVNIELKHTKTIKVYINEQ